MSSGGPVDVVDVVDVVDEVDGVNGGWTKWMKVQERFAVVLPRQE